MISAGRISTHWPLDQLIELVTQAEPDLMFELRPTASQPGEQWYEIFVDGNTRVDALRGGEKVRAALKGIPTGTDRTTIYAPQS